MTCLAFIAGPIRAAALDNASLFGEHVAYHVALTLLPLAILGGIALAIHRGFPRAPR